MENSELMEAAVDDRCPCGAQAEVGCHGIKDGAIYDQNFCEPCYNKFKKRGVE